MNKIYFDIIAGAATGQICFWLGYLTKSAIINRNRKQAQKEPVVPLPPCNTNLFLEAEKGAEFHEKTLGELMKKLKQNYQHIEIRSRNNIKIASGDLNNEFFARHLCKCSVYGWFPGLADSTCIVMLDFEILNNKEV